MHLSQEIASSFPSWIRTLQVLQDVRFGGSVILFKVMSAKSLEYNNNDFRDNLELYVLVWQLE